MNWVNANCSRMKAPGAGAEVFGEFVFFEPVASFDGHFGIGFRGFCDRVVGKLFVCGLVGGADDAGEEEAEGVEFGEDFFVHWQLVDYRLKLVGYSRRPAP